MSEENTSEAGSNVDVSSESQSTEIGSGNVEAEVKSESGNGNEVSGEKAAAIDDAAEQVQDAIDDGASKEEVQELIKTFKIKVNGKEKEITLDLNDNEDIIRRLQMAEGGHEAMQRSAEMEKNLEGEIQNLIDDPWTTLEDLGFDVDKLAEERIQSRINQLQKSPEEIAQDERNTELEELRQQRREKEEESEQQEFERLQLKAESDIDTQITEALSATTQLPKSPYIVKRVADAMLAALDSGRQDVTAKDVLPWVEKEINEELQELFAAMPDKVLTKYIGNQTMERLRKQRLSKMTPPSNTQIKEIGKNTEEENVKSPKIKIQDWLRGRKSLV